MWINPELITTEHKAFVYLITNLDTGERYIGKKNLYKLRYDKTLKKNIISPSDWRCYNSSSAIVKEWTNTSKVILYPCKTKLESSYIETRLLFIHDVLDPLNNFVNRNIGGNYFRHFPL